MASAFGRVASAFGRVASAFGRGRSAGEYAVPAFT